MTDTVLDEAAVQADLEKVAFFAIGKFAWVNLTNVQHLQAGSLYFCLVAQVM